MNAKVLLVLSIFLISSAAAADSESQVKIVKTGVFTSSEAVKLHTNSLLTDKVIENIVNIAAEDFKNPQKASDLENDEILMKILKELALLKALNEKSLEIAEGLTQARCPKINKTTSSSNANPADLETGLRWVPYFRGGTKIGVRVFSVPEKHQLKKLGVQEGDILLSINDQVVPEIQNLASEFGSFDQDSKPRIVLERNKRTMTLGE